MGLWAGLVVAAVGELVLLSIMLCRFGFLLLILGCNCCLMSLLQRPLLYCSCLLAEYWGCVQRKLHCWIVVVVVVEWLVVGLVGDA